MTGRLLEALGHHIKEELKAVAGDIHLGPVERIHKLSAVDVAVTTCVCRGKRLLKRDALRGERHRPDLLEHLLRSVEIDLLVELDLLCVESL